MSTCGDKIENVISGSAWYWYKKSERGEQKSKWWIIKDNLIFSELRRKTVAELQKEVDQAKIELTNAQSVLNEAQKKVDEAPTEVENANLELTKAQSVLNEAQKKVDEANSELTEITTTVLYSDFNKNDKNWKTTKKNKWKNNPFTKYIVKIQINMGVLIFLCILLLFLFIKFKYGVVRYIRIGLGFVIFIQILKVNNLMRGRGKLKTKNTEGLVTDPPQDSLLATIKNHLDDTKYNDFVDKLKSFPNKGFNKLFFYSLTENEWTEDKSIKIKNVIRNKYRTRKGIIWFLSLGIIIVPTSIFSKNWHLVGLYLITLLIMIIIYVSFSINGELPEELKKDEDDLTDNLITLCKK